MTVSEVIKQLEKLEPTSVVHLAKDEEGNAFHHLVEVQGEHKVVVLWPGYRETEPLG